MCGERGGGREEEELIGGDTSGAGFFPMDALAPESAPMLERSYLLSTRIF